VVRQLVLDDITRRTILVIEVQVNTNSSYKTFMELSPLNSGPIDWNTDTFVNSKTKTLSTRMSDRTVDVYSTILLTCEVPSLLLN